MIYAKATTRNRLLPCSATRRFPHLVKRSREIEAQGWSLDPGRYTGTASVADDGIDFAEKLAALYAEFTELSDEAETLRSKVDAAITGILGR